MPAYGQQITKDLIMTTTTSEEAKTRIITLTGRAPVKIVEADWPVIAQAKGDSFTGDISRYRQARANGEIDTYSLMVRRHADGRSIVYGFLDAALCSWRQPARGRSWRGGFLITPPQGLVMEVAVQLVADAMGTPDLGRECLANLPAEEI